MDTAIIAAENEHGRSARFQELLDNSGNWPAEGDGRCKVISERVGVNYATVQKWLHSNSVPRTPEERIRVARILKINIVFWEYGLDIAIPEEDDLTFLKYANATMTILQSLNLKIGVDITSEEVLRIELFAMKIGCKCGEYEPNESSLQTLISIALRQ